VEVVGHKINDAHSGLDKTNRAAHQHQRQQDRGQWTRQQGHHHHRADRHFLAVNTSGIDESTKITVVQPCNKIFHKRGQGIGGVGANTTGDPTYDPNSTSSKTQSGVIVRGTGDVRAQRVGQVGDVARHAAHSRRQIVKRSVAGAIGLVVTVQYILLCGLPAQKQSPFRRQQKRICLTSRGYTLDVRRCEGIALSIHVDR